MQSSKAVAPEYDRSFIDLPMFPNWLIILFPADRGIEEKILIYECC
ncbi:hypothetical protein [Nostoc sp.]